MSNKTQSGRFSIREFDAADGYFVLISDANGNLFAKAYDPRKARLIAEAQRLLEDLTELLDAVDAAYPAAEMGHAAQVEWAERRAKASRSARLTIARATT